MALAELVVHHSRPFAPTRRLALGVIDLPSAPTPGFGGILLGVLAAASAPEVHPEQVNEARKLLSEIEQGRRIVQPRVRHRFQTDRHGLTRSAFRLSGDAHQPVFDFDDDNRGTPLQYLLAAVYAAARVPLGERGGVGDAIRAGIIWTGGIDDALIAHLGGRGDRTAWEGAGFDDPVRWALDLLGLPLDEREPPERAVRRSFRDKLRAAHPDHGAGDAEAADQIKRLREARRILLD